MKFLFTNKFFYIKGGAENSFFLTADLLKKHGHEIIYFSMQDNRNIPSEFGKYFIRNVDYDTKDPISKISSIAKLFYSFEAKRKIDQLIKDTRPDIIYLNNIYHQISPSILHAIKKHDIPVVMALRDYKVSCGSYAMSDPEGRICEACKGNKYYHCFLKKCSYNSRISSAIITAEMYLHHNLLRIYDLVDVFISLSVFLKDKVKEMGFKGEVAHLPNFVYPDEFIPSYENTERSICYIGRLSKEKGIFTLINAVKGFDITLKIIGDGPDRSALEAQVRRDQMSNVSFLGYKYGEELKQEIKSSMFTVIPSEWYENNPRSVIESFALGKPVVGARIGGIPELVIDSETGLTFTPFDTADLRSKISLLLATPALIPQMGRNARQMVENELNADKYYTRIMDIFSKAKAKHEPKTTQKDPFNK